ncbi:peptidoglycan DD-metalloendopeptidase family protein [Hydrogenimonas sp.]
MPGGLAVVPLAADNWKAQVRFGSHEGALFRKNGRLFALVPIPLATRPGEYEVTVRREGGEVSRLPIAVRPTTYRTQYLTVKNRRHVNPAPEDLRRIRAEAPRKKRAKAFVSSSLASVDFLWPATGVVSSPFGLRRYFNGQPRAPHRGIDIAAPEGSPVVAAADGRVVEAGNFFFSGNLVFIEHGGGLTTLYAHLKRMAVKPGDTVKKGEVIGYVGHTGRVTGPHLHFATLVRGVYVDPTLLLPPRQEAKP